MSNKAKFLSALQQLGLALLNATLLLALALAVMVWLALGRVQDLAQGTQTALNEALAPQAERLERIATSVKKIEVDLADGTANTTLRDEVVLLRRNIETIHAQTQVAVEIGPQILAEQMTKVIIDLLAQNRPSGPS